MWEENQGNLAEKKYIWWNGTEDHWKSDWIKERSAGVIKLISACIYDLLLPYVTVEQLRARELQLKKVHQFCQRFKYLKTLQYSQTHYILDVMHISQILKVSVLNQPSAAPHTRVPPVPEISIQRTDFVHFSPREMICTVHGEKLIPGVSWQQSDTVARFHKSMATARPNLQPVTQICCFKYKVF